MLFELVVMGSSAAVGASLYKKQESYNKLVTWLGDFRDMGKEVKKLVWSDARHQQLLNLSSKREILARQKKEQDLNRNVRISLVSTGLAGIGTLLYAPLGLLSLPGMLYISKIVFNSAYHSLVERRKANVDLLILISNGVLLFSGSLFWCSTIILLYAVNHKLLHTIQTNTKSSLVDVFRQQPQVAWVIQDGVECEVSISELTSDSIILVGAGEVIPVDGRVVKGLASVDQQALTGESQPAERAPGDQVFAATLVLSGKIHVQVDHIGEQTTAAQIGHILNQTADTKTHQQLQVEALSDKTVLPTLLAGATIASLVSPISGWAVLQSHFKHRMTIVSGISLMNYLNLASHRGLLVKSGDVLEQLNDIDTIVFDKTGTLTEEVPEIGDIHLCGVYSADTVLQYAAAAEGKQTHPIARAIIQAVQSRDLSIPEIEQAAYQVGYGLSVTIDQRLIQLGSLRFMEMTEVSLPEVIKTAYANSSSVGHSMVLLAVDGEVVAGIELNPKVRPEAEDVIAGLHQRGIQKTYIISGDHIAPTQKLAESLGIDDYFAEVLPEQKATLIADLQKTGKKICFVGDGINDCIAMKQADVSISLGDASTIAVDTAQVILLDNNLTQLGELFDLSHAFISRTKSSYALVTLPGLVGICGALFWHFSITGVMLLPQLGLTLGVLHSMYPLLKYNSIHNIASQTCQKGVDSFTVSDGKIESKTLNFVSQAV